MDDPTIAGAILGAVIAGTVAVLIFVIERVVTVVSAWRERRRLAFLEVMSAFTQFAQAGIRTFAHPAGVDEVRLLTSSSELQLVLGPRWKSVSFWILGMQARLVEAVNLPSATALERKTRQDEIQEVITNVNNVLLDLHHGRLFLNDLLIPGGLFWAESMGVDVRAQYPDEFKRALRPTSKGWDAAFSAAVLGFVPRRWLRLQIWLGFRKPNVGSPEDVAAGR